MKRPDWQIVLALTIPGTLLGAGVETFSIQHVCIGMALGILVGIWICILRSFD